MEDGSILKQVKVYNEVQTKVKEAIICEASWTEGNSLQGLYLIRLLRNNIPKHILFHQKVMFIALLYFALLKFLKD